MHVALVAFGLALTFIGYVVEHRQPRGFNRGRAVGVVLFVIGEILLFQAGWWWGLLGLAGPPMLIDVLLAVVRRR